MSTRHALGIMRAHKACCDSAILPSLALCASAVELRMATAHGTAPRWKRVSTLLSTSNREDTYPMYDSKSTKEGKTQNVHVNVQVKSQYKKGERL